MATVVPTSDEEQVLNVARLTAKYADSEVDDGHMSKLCLEAEECMKTNRWMDLARAMINSAAVIFFRAPLDKVRWVYNVICNLVKKYEKVDQKQEIAELIAKTICQSPNDEPALRLNILLNFCNLLENTSCQFHVYMKSLNFARTGKVTAPVLPSFNKLDEFLKKWNLGVKDQRDLFLAVADVLNENKGSTKDSFNFLVKYLSTFSAASASTLAEAKKVAVRAITEFIKAPDMFQADLLYMSAITQLEKDAAHAAVYQLLKIFLTQRLDAYMDFESANAGVLEKLGLVHEDCVAKMRLI